MFCIQCEQTIRRHDGVLGCQYSHGVCGKTADVSDLQDILIKALQALSFWALQANEQNLVDDEVDRWAFNAFFSTLTNVNFDATRIEDYIQQAAHYIERLKSTVLKSGKEIPPLSPAAQHDFSLPIAELEKNIAQFRLNKDGSAINDDVQGLRLLCLYGVKGAAAYMDHAVVLGKFDREISLEYHRIMNFLGNEPTDINALFEMAMQIGQFNYRVLEKLNAGETDHFGDPVPTKVNMKPVKGKCILVSGHDLRDLELILQQTEGTGINVYTHGELLPAHGYPNLKKYAHLVGNFGSAWQNQQHEFAQFPGAIVMTSNCIIDPFVGDYQSRIFTRNMVGWQNVQHLHNDDFSDVIECALAQEGFLHSEIPEEIIVGFAQKSLESAAPAVVEQIKQGNISHVFLIGGCDGAKDVRNYYTEFATNVPKDNVILTLGCAKYRFNKYDFGDINGIPRLLDVGQCNDSFSAIQLALSLSKIFDCSVNELPLTLVLSWFEQKAIAVLLTLLSLGIKGIYAGPTLPAFLTPNLVAILQEKFDLHPTDDPAQDMEQALHRLSA